MTEQQHQRQLWLDEVAWPVQTARLSLRPTSPQDHDALWRYRRLPDVGRWTFWWPQTPTEMTEILISQMSQSLVIEVESVVVGDLMVNIGDAWGQWDVARSGAAVQAELGWALHPDVAGRGYATEAVEALMRLCFTTLGLRRVTAHAFAANEPSWRLMERLGMRRELHTVRDSLHRDLGWVDGVMYALLAEEWAARST